MSDGHMTPEEVERHLESRQTYLELVPEKAPPTVPTEMFSNDPSLDRWELISSVLIKFFNAFCLSSNHWNIIKTKFFPSESNEIGELETSPSNMGEDCLSVDMMAEW